MSTRAAAAEATRERIAAAAHEAFLTRWYDDVTLRDVAAAAGVALQTVVNHFGTKDGLFAAFHERLGADISSLRWAVEPGDLGGAVRALVDDYERHGDAILRILALEERVEVVREPLTTGRREHEQWVQTVFAAALDSLTGTDRSRRLAQLVVATDVYAWKLLRRDKGLSRVQTELAIRELVLALHPQPLEGGSE